MVAATLCLCHCCSSLFMAVRRLVCICRGMCSAGPVIHAAECVGCPHVVACDTLIGAVSVYVVGVQQPGFR